MLLYLLARLSYSCSRLLVDLHACVTTRTRECYYSYSRVLLLVLASVITRTREVYYSYTRVLLLVHVCVSLASATLHSIGTVAVKNKVSRYSYLNYIFIIMTLAT